MARNEVQLHWGLQIPLRDGVRLNATLYLPVHHGQPSAAICTMTPYVGQSCHDQAVYFASHGYPFVAVDVRGRGNSEGKFHPINEAKDGYDVVEWLARQPYCNGKVAMWGGSYSGFVQWSVAKERPPHLATMVPVASPYRGVDSPLRNNMFIPYTVQWLTLTSGRTVQDKLALEDRSFWSAQFRRWFQSGAPFRTLDSLAGNPSALFQEWLDHPLQDEYWDQYNPTAREYAQLSVPVLTITGMYDANQAGALTHYCQHMKHASAEGRAHHFLVIGPWDHAGTRIPKADFGGLHVGEPSLMDLRELHLQWYAWAMQEGDRPPFLRKAVAYYVTGSDRWRYADSLAGVTAGYLELFLHSSGNPDDVFKSGSLLSDRSGATEPDWYVYDPCDVGAAELQSKVDPDSLVEQRLLLASTGKRLIYHSAPFGDGTEISGSCKLSLWLSIDQPDTDFAVALYEIALDGSSILLSTDSMRARYRESFRTAKLIRTQDPLRYDFERFTFASRQLASGSRLRLVIGPVNSIYGEKNYNAGGAVCEESVKDARRVTVKLFHDESRPSALYLPLGRAGSVE